MNDAYPTVIATDPNNKIHNLYTIIPAYVSYAMVRACPDGTICFQGSSASHYVASALMEEAMTLKSDSRWPFYQGSKT